MGLSNNITKEQLARSAYNLSGHPVKDLLGKWISDVTSELEILSDGVASASPQGVTDVSNSLSNVSSMQNVVSDLLSDTISSLKVVSDQASEISWQLSDTSSSLSNVSSMQTVVSDLLLTTSNSASNVSSMQNVLSNHLSDYVSGIVAAQTKFKSDFDVVSGGDLSDSCSDLWTAISDILVTLSNGLA